MFKIEIFKYYKNGLRAFMYERKSFLCFKWWQQIDHSESTMYPNKVMDNVTDWIGFLNGKEVSIIDNT